MQLDKCIVALVTSAPALFGHWEQGWIAYYINAVIQAHRAEVSVVPGKAQHKGVEDTVVDEYWLWGLQHCSKYLSFAPQNFRNPTPCTVCDKANSHLAIT